MNSEQVTSVMNYIRRNAKWVMSEKEFEMFDLALSSHTTHSSQQDFVTAAFVRCLVVAEIDVSTDRSGRWVVRLDGACEGWYNIHSRVSTQEDALLLANEMREKLQRDYKIPATVWVMGEKQS